jgi:hypothetical protein
MKRCAILVGLIIFMVIFASAQDEERVPPATTPSAIPDSAPESDADRMMTPPPVSGQAYPVVLTSQERSNYLRGGLTFMSAYTDNALGSASGTPLSDVSYSVMPFLSVDQTTTREHLALTYAPGYTFYQRFSSRDEADQNATVNFGYRLSPHVTFSATDTFLKSSNVFSQLDPGTVVSPGVAVPNFSIITPIAGRLNNAGNGGLTYQFELDDMIGASGTFMNLHYLDPAQLPGLSDSSSQAGLVFWAHRLSRRHYFGVTYQYQRLVAYPTQGLSETQTHAPLLFYSVSPANRVLLSFFGGPQYSDSVEPSPLLPFKQWTPAGGASLSWQARLTSLAISYAHIISASPGLGAAVKLDNGSASVSQQITNSLSASLSGGYAQNDLVGNFTSLLGSFNGHSIMGTATVHQQFGRNVTLQLGYTRVRQDYGGVPILALTPNTNREFVSLSYHFDRALGR